MSLARCGCGIGPGVALSEYQYTYSTGTAVTYRYIVQNVRLSNPENDPVGVDLEFTSLRVLVASYIRVGINLVQYVTFRR
jgi:hypothetical protein